MLLREVQAGCTFRQVDDRPVARMTLSCRLSWVSGHLFCLVLHFRRVWAYWLKSISRLTYLEFRFMQVVDLSLTVPDGSLLPQTLHSSQVVGSSVWEFGMLRGRDLAAASLTTACDVATLHASTLTFSVLLSVGG